MRREKLTRIAVFDIEADKCCHYHLPEMMHDLECLVSWHDLQGYAVPTVRCKTLQAELSYALTIRYVCRPLRCNLSASNKKIVRPVALPRLVQ